MGFMSKKRLLLTAGGFTTVAAAGMLVAGTTFGLFSATENNTSSTITAGTVSVGLDSGGTQVTCSVNTAVPGDSTTNAAIGNKTAHASCEFDVKYTGNVNAYVGVDAAITGITNGLYDGSNQGLQLYLSDGTTTYLTSTAGNGQSATGNGTTYDNQADAATSLPTTGVSNLLVSPTADVPNATHHFTLDWAIPLSSGNTYQGGTATVQLTFHATQASNQTLPSCAAGDQCNASSTFAWGS